jgi:hypothetical protein
MKKTGQDMDRREFLRKAGAWATALGARATLIQTGDPVQAAPGQELSPAAGNLKKA